MVDMRAAIQNGDDILKEDVKMSAFKAVMLKIIINFFLVTNISTVYGFNFTGIFRHLFRIFMQIVPSSDTGFSIDCFIALNSNEYHEIFFVNFALKLAKPIFLWVVFAIVYLLKRVIFIKKDPITKM